MPSSPHSGERRATSDERPGTAAARLALLGAAVLFSTGGAAIKLTTMTSWQVASIRSGVAALALCAFLPVARRDLDWRGLLVAAAYAATMILFVVGNKLTTAANTIFLQSTAPLYVLLLGPALLGEPIRRRDLAVMATIAAGLVLFFVGREPSLRTAPDPMRGNLIAALGGPAWAFTVLGLRWLSRQPARSTGATLVAGNALACLVCLPLALPVSAPAGDWLLVSFLGVFQIAAAYVLVTIGLRRVTALEAVLLLLLEPVLNPVWAALVHGERPGPWALAGGAIVLAATLAKALGDRRTEA